MDKLFLTILNMSMTGAFIIAAICVARLPLKKAPKIISYCLWGVAGFRLVFPYSIESVFSLIPFKAQTIPPDIALQPIPRIDSGIPFLNNAVSSILPAATPTASVNPLQIWTAIGAWVWIFGVAVLLIYGFVSFFILKRKMSEAAHIEANIYEAENIKSPFVLGIFNPRMYLPIGLSEQEKSYIILHEQTHIKRHDHIVKFAAYFVLCLHWFNPLAWVAFLLMGVDMEMSCDERVLKEMGGETKKNYSLSLLSLATERRIIGGSPLAFGEGGIKERIKNVLNFKKPSRAIIVTAVTLVAVLSVGFAVNKINAPAEPPNITVQSGDKNIEWVVGKNKWNGSVFDRLDNFQWLMTDKTIDDLEYVRNGEQVLLEFDGSIPDSITLTEYVLLENGNEKYNLSGMEYDVHYNAFNARFNPFSPRDFNFTVEPNYATALSSNSADYQTGNTIKVYRIVCTWGGNECEYAFIVRGDAAFTMQVVPSTIYEPRKWLDYYNPRGDGPIPYDRSLELELPEFPDTVFNWTAYEVKAIDASGERVLFDGWPIHNVFLTDLNGDELPELCATISIGFGLIDTRVIVYDYANDIGHDLSDRGYYDYSLSIDDGQLVVTQTRYSENGSQAIGSMAIINGELVVFGIDRTKPDTEPQETTQPEDTSLLSSWKPLHELPADYSKEQAIADGVYVNIHGSEIYNQELVDIFYAGVSTGSAAFMRVMQYTIEGDAIITDYQYDGEIFTVNHDSTRDKYMGADGRVISTTTYKYLVPPNGSHPTISPQNYYLSSEQNIIEGTAVWWVPPPSNNASNQ